MTPNGRRPSAAGLANPFALSGHGSELDVNQFKLDPFNSMLRRATC
jgi:hypothetical protein